MIVAARFGGKRVARSNGPPQQPDASAYFVLDLPLDRYQADPQPHQRGLWEEYDGRRVGAIRG